MLRAAGLLPSWFPRQRSNTQVHAGKACSASSPSDKLAGATTAADERYFTFNIGGFPQWNGQLPEDSTLKHSESLVKVANAALKFASEVAVHGYLGNAVGGFLLIIGDASRLRDNKLGSCGKGLNKYLENKVTVFDVNDSQDTWDFVAADFLMDKAMVACGKEGRILAHQWAVTDISKGITDGGTKLQAGSAIAQQGFFAIKCSEDSCSCDGSARGSFNIFVGTKDYHSVAVKKDALGPTSGPGSGPANPRPFLETFSADFDEAGAPQWDGPFPRDGGYCREVVNAVLKLVSYVATKGIGENNPAYTGFVVVIGKKQDLMDDPLAEFSRHNRYAGFDIQAQKLFEHGHTKDMTFVKPGFVMKKDQALAIDGHTGRLLVDGWKPRNAEQGLTRQKWAEKVAKPGLFCIACEQDACSCDGGLHGVLHIFAGRSECFSMPVHGRPKSLTGALEDVCMQVAFQPPTAFLQFLQYDPLKHTSWMIKISKALQARGAQDELMQRTINITDSENMWALPEAVNLYSFVWLGVGRCIGETGDPILTWLTTQKVKEIKVVIVALLYGAPLAAQAVKELGAKTVIWLCVDMQTMDVSQILDIICDALRFVNSGTPDKIHQLSCQAGLLQDEPEAHVLPAVYKLWTQKCSSRSGQRVFTSTCNLPVPTNLLPKSRVRRLLAVDVGEPKILSTTLQTSCGVQLHGKYERCLSVAFETCVSLLLQSRDYEFICHISSTEDLEVARNKLERMERMQTPKHALLWIDVFDANIDQVYKMHKDRLHLIVMRCEVDLPDTLKTHVLCDVSHMHMDEASDLLQCLSFGVKSRAVTTSSTQDSASAAVTSLRQEIGSWCNQLAILRCFPDVCTDPNLHAQIVACLHIPSIKVLQQLAYKILCNEFDTSLVSISCEHFSRMFKETQLRLNRLTDHQHICFEEIKKLLQQQRAPNKVATVHLRAAPGAGKTFLAVHAALERLLDSSKFVLFVCGTRELSYFFTKWLVSRTSSGQVFGNFDNSVLSRLHVAFCPWECPHAIDLDSGLLSFKQFQGTKPRYALVIVDEAHDVYSSTDGRREVQRYCCLADNLLVLSDISQSLVGGIDYDIPEERCVELHEVVRSTKRIVLASNSFSLREPGHTMLHNQLEGPPLKVLMFTDLGPKCDLSQDLAFEDYDCAIETYAAKVLQAISHVCTTLRNMDLHNNVAIIVPDEKFRCSLQLSKLFLSRLKGSHRHEIKLIRAEDSCREVDAPYRHNSIQSIVLDSAERFAGLEFLAVIAVGLDKRIDQLFKLQVRRTRLQIYQSLARAQLLAVAVNAHIPGGWLDFLGRVQFTGSPLTKEEEYINTKSSLREPEAVKVIQELEAEAHFSTEEKVQQQDEEELFHGTITTVWDPSGSSFITGHKLSFQPMLHLQVYKTSVELSQDVTHIKQHVVNAAIHWARTIACHGVGELQKAHGLFFILGNAESLVEEVEDLYPKFGITKHNNVWAFKANGFRFDIQNMTKEAEKTLKAACKEDGAVVIDGESGQIWCANWMVGKMHMAADGLIAKTAAASSIAVQAGGCFVIKASESICGHNGQPPSATSMLEVFNCRNGRDLVPLHIEQHVARTH